MPDINVQEREHRGVPWWVWLIGAALLLALLWWMLAPRQERVVIPPGAALVTKAGSVISAALTP